jgi:predicted Zn-ribbon and HTH transcriptional regulator
MATESQKSEALRKVEMRLSQIRLQAIAALQEIADLDVICEPHWVCLGCGYEKHFTKPATIAACEKCPRCQSEDFAPMRSRK